MPWLLLWRKTFICGAFRKRKDAIKYDLWNCRRLCRKSGHALVFPRLLFMHNVPWSAWAKRFSLFLCGKQIHIWLLLSPLCPVLGRFQTTRGTPPLTRTFPPHLTIREFSSRLSGLWSVVSAWEIQDSSGFSFWEKEKRQNSNIFCLQKIKLPVPANCRTSEIKTFFSSALVCNQPRNQILGRFFEGQILLPAHC